MKKTLSLSAFALLTLSSSYALANEQVNTTYDDGYLKLQTANGSFSLKLDGRIMLDAGAVGSSDNGFVENNSVRRARFAIKTSYNNQWAGEFDIDFSDNEAEIKDMWVSYIGLENFQFKIGNHKPFFSLAELTTSRWATFMETSSITDATGPGRRLGVSASYSDNKSLFAGVSIFGDGIDVDNRDPAGDESEPGVHEQYSYSFRALYRPFVNEDVSKFFHVGINHMNLKPESDADSRMRLKAGLENSVFDYDVLSTGKVRHVSEQVSSGIEFAARYERVMFQAEYITNTFNRTSSDYTDVDTSGYYIETSYMLLGSGRNYNLSDGEFGPVFPEHSIGNVELALRFSHTDFNDPSSDVYGGESSIVTLGVNWYAHSNVVFRLNHSIASLDEHADGNGDYLGNDDTSVTGLRIQYMF